jgi:hypothetical protein
MYIPQKFKIDKGECSLLNAKKIDPRFVRSKKIRDLLIKLDAKILVDLLDEAPFLNQLCLLNEKIPVAYIINFPETYIFTEKLFLFTLEVYSILEENNAKVFDLGNNNILIFLPKNQLTACKIAYLEEKIKKQNSDIKLKNLRQFLLISNTIIFKNFILRKYIRYQLPKKNGIKPPKEQEQLVNNFYDKYIKSKKKEIEKFEDYYLNILNECSNLEEELFTSKNFDKFQKVFDKKVKDFKFPLKSVFGGRRPYSYELFKNMIDKFNKQYIKDKKEYEKNV